MEKVIYELTPDDLEIIQQVRDWLQHCGYDVTDQTDEQLVRAIFEFIRQIASAKGS